MTYRVGRRAVINNNNNNNNNCFGVCLVGRESFLTSVGRGRNTRGTILYIVYYTGWSVQRESRTISKTINVNGKQNDKILSNKFIVFNQM